MPQAKRLDPVAGMMRCIANLKHLPHVLLRLFVVGVLFGWFLLDFLQDIKGLIFLAFDAQWTYAVYQVWLLFIWGAILLTSLGLIDYCIKRRRWFQKVGMSMEDMRKEHREEEGDPLWRAFRRAQHEELVHQSLVKRVRQSRVIVVEKQ